MQFRLTNSQWYLVVGLHVGLVGLVGLVESVGLVGLGLPLTVTIRVSRVSAMVSAGLAFTKYRCEFVNLNCIFTELYYHYIALI